MPEKVHIDVGREPRGPRRPDGPRRSGGELVPWVIALVLLAAVGGSWWFFRMTTTNARRTAEAAMRQAELARADAIHRQILVETRARMNADAEHKKGGARRETVVDRADVELLWASPTAGPPIALDYVPAGTQCLVFLRPALLASHPEGEKVIAALGPWGRGAVASLESLTHAKLAELEAVLVAILVDDRGALAASVRAQLVAPWDDAELPRRWPDAEPRQHGEQSYHVAGERAGFLATGADGSSGRTLVACPAGMAEELIDTTGTPPMLARDLERLVAVTDADRAVTVIVAPKFLDAGGSGLMTGAAAPLQTALAAFLDNGATAVALSAHWDENFFVEMRAAPALNTPPRSLAAALHKRVGELPAQLDDHILAQAWPSFGRRVIARFPGMLRQLALTARSGDADRQALLRAYLPAIAGHNLLMGAELVLTQQGGADAGTAQTGVAAAPQTIDQRLAANTSLAFPKDTLQRALELLAENLGVLIEVDGGELRAEGITQNQSLSLELRDRPGEEILVEILRLANPDRTAESLADIRQKLVYVVEAGAGAGGRIIVTTRAAAERRGLSLPAVFGSGAE